MTVSEERSADQHSTSSEKQFFQNHLRLTDFHKSETLKMLTQHRLPVHIEYLQPHLSVPETKASPLALLAATCSSIGKPDHEKKEQKPTLSNLSNKTREMNDKRSSFEPYKADKKLRGSDSPPSLTQTNSISTSKTSIMSTYEDDKQRARDSVKHEKAREMKDIMHQYRCIPPSPPFAHLAPRVPMMPGHHHHMGHEHHHHSECTQCKQHRPHSEPLALTRPPPPPLPTPCGCSMCIRSDSKCHFQHPTAALSTLYPPSPYKHIPPPMLNSCRDPNCNNCSKPASNLQNFLHPALIHQCTHGALPHKPIFPPPPVLPSHSSTHEHPSKTNPKPFVCNWVSEGKHCGGAYATSEELFQHLRTHTSLQNQQQNECETLPIVSQAGRTTSQNTCKIHGCPCNSNNNPIKTSPRTSNIPGYAYGPVNRYSPYQRSVSSAGTSAYNYPPHGFHY